MSVGTVILLILILLLIGALPTWPHSKEYGFVPSGVLGTIVLVLIILWAAGRL